MGHPVGRPQALGDGEPPVHRDGGDGPRGHEGVGALHGGYQLAGYQPQEPLAPVQALGEGGGDADDAGGDAGDAKVQDVQVLGCPMSLLACKMMEVQFE